MNRRILTLGEPVPAGVVTDFSHIDVPHLPDVPGMIKPEEGQYLHWLAKSHWTEAGHLIEIGTWLGRSTLNIASGVQARGTGAKMLCYDHFEWAGGGGWNQKNAPDKSAGSDFMPEFLANTAPYADSIEAHRAKISELRLPEGKIEVLILDAPKRIIDISTILVQLADKAIAGQTITAWQDFLHPPSFEIPAALYGLRDYMEPCHFVTQGTVIGLRVVKPWDAQAALPGRLSHKAWTPEEAQAAWDYWHPFIPQHERESFRSGLAMLLHDIGHKEAARDILKSCLKDPVCLARWQKWDDTSLPSRYRSLFSLLEEEIT